MTMKERGKRKRKRERERGKREREPHVKYRARGCPWMAARPFGDWSWCGLK